MTTLSCIPYAVGHRDEGVCLGIEIGAHRILLDCGLDDVSPLLLDEPWDAVVCSHAHADHARGLLALRHHLPDLPIYTSLATAMLVSLNWPEAEVSAHNIAEGLPWRMPVVIPPRLSVQQAAAIAPLSDRLTVELWPAGHLPGAAATLLTYQNPTECYRVLHLGDCFLSAMRLVEGLPLMALRGLEPDVLIVDGTYGAQRYPHRRRQENDLTARLRHLLDVGGRSRVVFPVPTLGLGQELLMLLRSHYHTAGYPVTIWVDPIVAKGCDAYLAMPEALSLPVQNFAQNQSVFWDDRVFPHVRRLSDRAELTEALARDEPAIFLVHPATPPMTYCQDATATWTVFLLETGLAAGNLAVWQAEHPGPESDRPVPYDWLDAIKNATASGTVQLETYRLTDHCDGASTTQIIHNLKPRHVILQHGDPTNLAALANLETLQTRYKLHLPTPQQTLKLPLDTQFWRHPQPMPPPDSAIYEGELSAPSTQSDITLTLPADVTVDPRWRGFAETGLVTAQWQGDKLVIQGVAPGDLVNVRSHDPLQDTVRPICANCQGLQGQTCRQTTSPLFNKVVALDATCPEFRPPSP
ncbi:MAG: MBL fold metallo-hydrolase [Cyanobacteria bacterium J06632_22]